jgi:hypothetical protein
MCSLPAVPVTEALLRWADGRYAAELAEEITETAREAGGDEGVDGGERSAREASLSDGESYFTDELGQTYEAVMLSTSSHLVALLVLAVPAGPRNVPSRELLRDVAEELLGGESFPGVQLLQ